MVSYSFGNIFGSVCCSVLCALPFALVAVVVAFLLLNKKEGSNKYLILLGIFLGVLLFCGGCAFLASLLNS